MNSVKAMRLDVKKYIDTADAKVVKMVHAMLEVDADNDWWQGMPDNVRKDVDDAIIESDSGVVIPHEEIQKRYQKWLLK